MKNDMFLKQYIINFILTNNLKDHKLIHLLINEY